MSDDDFVPFEEPGLEPLGSSIPDMLRTVEGRMRVSGSTESPIETILGAALLNAARLWFPDDKAIAIKPQFVWRRYRIDWAISLNGTPILFVECDGRDYHSSDEAMQRDSARDAECETAGIEVVRVSGSSIHRDPKKCAHAIIDRIISIRRAHG